MMFQFLAKIAAKQHMSIFDQQIRFISVVLCGDLKCEYSKEMDEESASFLAAQVVNYLQGEDIEQVYTSASEPNKSKIGRIKDQVAVRADELLTRDKDIRKLIVYTQRMRIIFRHALLGKTYSQSPQMLRDKNMLGKFGAEYPEEVNPKLYRDIVDHYAALPH